MPELKSALANQIEDEVQDYLTRTVTVSENNDFSQAKLIKRISLFENHIYPKGKFDKQGNYKFWFDIITPRIDAEVKNIDFDTKNVEVYSPRKIDASPSIITNLKVKEYLRETGQAEEINSAIEEGAGWGNVIWKKVKGGYERTDLRNTYVINQTARTLNESPVIERHQLTQTDLRKKIGPWSYVSDVIKECGENIYSETQEVTGATTTTPYYDIYERNGEVSLYDLKTQKGEKAVESDKEKYVLAKVIGAGTKSLGATKTVEIKYILFADEISKMPYKEYHRSRYKGRWFREGLYELLFDVQVRANQIGNQLAQGLEWASKIIFNTEDKLIVQNILTDLKNGDIIRSKNISQVPVAMQGFTELANEWNRIIEIANEIANSREVVQGEAQAGQPFRLGALLNQNANKMFDFIREKLAIPFSEIFEEWIIPSLIKDLKIKDILRITGDSDLLERLYMMIVDAWYVDNLVFLPPHNKELAESFKQEKLEELKSRPQLLMTNIEQMWKGFTPHVSVVITGEQINLNDDLQTMATFAQLEADPIRRSAIVEEMARKRGLDFGSLPKTEQPQPIQQGAQPNNLLATLGTEKVA